MIRQWLQEKERIMYEHRETMMAVDEKIINFIVEKLEERFGLSFEVRHFDMYIGFYAEINEDENQYIELDLNTYDFSLCAVKALDDEMEIALRSLVQNYFEETDKERERRKEIEMILLKRQVEKLEKENKELKRKIESMMM